MRMALSNRQNMAASAAADLATRRLFQAPKRKRWVAGPRIPSGASFVEDSYPHCRQTPKGFRAK